MSETSPFQNEYGAKIHFEPPACPSCNAEASVAQTEDAMRDAQAILEPKSSMEKRISIQVLELVCTGCSQSYNAKLTTPAKNMIFMFLGIFGWLGGMFATMFITHVLTGGSGLAVFMATTGWGVIVLIVLLVAVSRAQKSGALRLKYISTDKQAMAHDHNKEEYEKQVQKNKFLENWTTAMFFIIALIYALKFFFS